LDHFGLKTYTFGLVSCGGDDVDCDPEVYEAELSMLSGDLFAAAFAYGFDPSPENCEAYKDALDEYLNEAEKYESCAEDAGELKEFREALDEARAELDQLEC
jgi:hypothetical protein